MKTGLMSFRKIWGGGVELGLDQGSRMPDTEMTRQCSFVQYEWTVIPELRCPPELRLARPRLYF